MEKRPPLTFFFLEPCLTPPPLPSLYGMFFPHTCFQQCFWESKHSFFNISNLYGTRDCHGFSNPHGSWAGVSEGTGTGWQFTPPKKPMPAAWV